MNYALCLKTGKTIVITTQISALACGGVLTKIYSFPMSLNPEIPVVGLTGGIASGKSTALNVFKSLGWSVISADCIVAEIFSTNEDIQNRLATRWGKGINKDSGSIDKAEISRIIFNNKPERTWLESILHPLVRSQWISFVQSHPDDHCMIELPLLFENNLQKHFTFTISMYTPPKVTLERLSSRGISAEEAEKRISAQMPPFSKAENADFVLWGGGKFRFLKMQIESLSAQFL